MAEVEEPSEHTYMIRPNFQHKFRPIAVKDCIHEILRNELAGKEYDPEEVSELTKQLSTEIKEKLKELEYERYKIVVQVIIGEQRGEGVKVASRCFWDCDTDNYAQDVYMNDTLFCVAAAFGVYYY
ncbi:PREDICTED: tctex1 domain-containing protein 2-like [Priapulus caudatus]|uniref:Tctex1 domain-containing protein 2-like n=1 Tax=Priapulus caudatus TaxID=37621 RepID=A0ABM1FAD2_PRICU|nr:PREDICTED: tctex1 domain-containing protein 2-like [Priapulus caudatus]XP_014681405.1 PREDICTED: tctex1 domain-containing protein 2-like [Priapulus caudatus]